MKALLLGATGLLGRSLYLEWSRRPGWTVGGTSKSFSLPGLEPLDILDGSALRETLRRHRPGAVVQLASDPFVDGCQSDPAKSRLVNVEAACAAAEETARLGACFVFFSSDYVFDGANAPYSESDPTCPLNEYGRQKVEAEAAIARICPDHLILRTSGLFGWEMRRKNFVLQVLDRLAAGGDVAVAGDIRYHPTYALDLCDATARLLERGCRGLYHAVGADGHSRYEFARLIAEVFGLNGSKIRSVRQADLKLPAVRPPDSSLSTRKLVADAGVRPRTVRLALEHMRATTSDWEESNPASSSPRRKMV